jgi:hypothetical protein
VDDSSSQPKAAEKRLMSKGDNRAVWSQKMKIIHAPFGDLQIKGRGVTALGVRRVPSRKKSYRSRGSVVEKKEAKAQDILHTLKFVPMAFPPLFFLLFLVAMPLKGSGKASRVCVFCL